MGSSKPKESKKRFGTDTGRVNAKKTNTSNFNEKAPFRPLKTQVPKTQKQLFDKIYELINAPVAEYGYDVTSNWDTFISKGAASVTTYLVSNKLVDLEP